MKIRNSLILLIIVVAIAIVAVTVYFAMNPKDNTLEFQVRNSVSKGWVWDATITLQDRSIRGYYQTDRGPINYRFTRLEPGEYEMTISASGYDTVTAPVTIKKGDNTLDAPIDMVAYEIPNLERFIIFEEYEGGDIVQEIRLVGTDGRAVLNHPCMNLQIAALVSVQTKGGMAVQEETEVGSDRGDLLFQGKIDWSWAGVPETYFRYSSRIPGSQIKKSSAPYMVIDYLILVPDPRKISDEELETILGKAGVLQDFEKLQTYLENESGDRFSYYLFTSWNVPGGSV
jgi:hypothetical protein